MLRTSKVTIVLGLVLGPTALLLGQAQKQSSTTASPTQAKTDAYRTVTPKDKLYCWALYPGYVVRNGGYPSGAIDSFKCDDKQGNEQSIALKSTKLSNGRIETKEFGTIIVTAAGFSSPGTLAMKESE